MAYISIPARLNSSRTPKKILRTYKGRTILEHTVRAALEAARSGTDTVVLLTDSLTAAESLPDKIKQSIRTYISTGEYTNGTERIAHEFQSSSVLRGLDGTAPENLILNLQCDMAEIPPDLISSFILSSEAAKASCGEEGPGMFLSTVLREVSDSDDLDDPNIVKYSGQTGFVRSLPKNSVPKDFYIHIGLYAFDFQALRAYAGTEASLRETSERLEQLRFDSMGLSYRTMIYRGAPGMPISVDTLAFRRKNGWQ